MNGQHPVTGERLIRHKDTVKTQAGDELGHRAGWDVTINASKSVSVTALVGQDHALREAHLRAERTAIEWGSQFIQARTGARTPAETTAKALWISFEHTTARPVNGYSAPQLHGHNILVNLTRDSAGKWRSLQTAELFRIQKGIRELAKLIRSRLGLEFQDDAGLVKLRSVTLRYVLAAEFRSDLSCAAPANLDAVPAPKTKDDAVAARELARRLRLNFSAAYPALADRHCLPFESTVKQGIRTMAAGQIRHAMAI